MRGQQQKASKPSKRLATAGNRTRVARVAGEHHTTRPQLLLDVRLVKSLILINSHV